ncbi:DUF58 domain-containing protein [Luteipulveratus halotolerans]|uniref:DUF58 domain-containing protein n=1 Tax=Luteipulveratus halotolerans TaxID=1631356 RepID=A0A0L6CGD1_9MICO|nr:DUF58 domain-containing protein [Luteipulveratus halotolerans]KNX36881.1 hypothetical protein VV01_06520 [Luteipulveratus halotolerans]
MSEDRPRTLTGRGRALLTCGITLVLGGVLLGFPDITRIGVLLAALPLIARLLARRRPPRLGIERTVSPSRLQPDERAEVTVDFANLGEKSTPLYLAEERIAYVLGDRPRFLLPRLESGARRRLTYRVRCHARGRHELGPIALQQQDPFGLTHVDLIVQSVGEVVVLPRIEELGGGRPPGSGLGNEGETPQMVALHGEEDVSIRAYHDGDDLRKVHWPATAHRGEMMVRQEDRPARRSAVLLLDSRREGHSGSGSHSSFEWAVSAIASIAVQLDQNGYTLHLAARETLLDGTVDQPRSAAEVVDILAVADLGTDREHDQLVQAAHGVTERGGSLVAAVSNLDDRSVSDLAGLRQPGTSSLAMVLDASAIGEGRRTTGPVAVAHCELLGSAGWRVVPVTSGITARHAWESLTRSGTFAVGAR